MNPALEFEPTQLDHDSSEYAARLMSHGALCCFNRALLTFRTLLTCVSTFATRSRRMHLSKLLFDDFELKCRQLPHSAPCGRSTHFPSPPLHLLSPHLLFLSPLSVTRRILRPFPARFASALCQWRTRAARRIVRGAVGCENAHSSSPRFPPGLEAAKWRVACSQAGDIRG